MEISNFERSQVLVQALPYIQKYYQKTIVIKYGGNAMINEGLKDAVMTDIVLLSLVGIHVVLVHGGGPEINAMLDRLGKESRFCGRAALYGSGNHGRGADGARGQGQ